MQRLGEWPAKHLFEVEVRKYDTQRGAFVKERVEVDANSRVMVCAILKRLGYEVLSINMVG